MLMLPPRSFSPDAYMQNRATRMIQAPSSHGVPLDFVLDNANFDGVIRKEYYDKCMAIKAIMEQGRTVVMNGDCVQLLLANGEVYQRNAHMEQWSDELWNVCLGGTVPHVRLNGSAIHTEASGGPWEVIEGDTLVDTGRRVTRMFWTWGGYAGANRGLYFRASVKLWEARLNWK